MTKEQAMSRFWEGMNYRERAMFQLFEPLLCMPFNVFHEAVEKALHRPVYTHEFGLNWAGLQAEIHGEQSSPTLEEIINLIPADKRVIVTHD